MTVGLSPKLYPAVFAVLVGLVVAIAVDKTAGLSILATGMTALGAGYVAPPGEVIPGEVGEGSDARLSAEAAAILNRVDPPDEAA